MTVIKVNVKCTPNGLGENNKPKEFSFTAHAPRDIKDWDDHLRDSINMRVIQEARIRTDCNSITINEVEFHDYLS